MSTDWHALPPTLDDLNRADADRFVAYLAEVWEHAPWVAQDIVDQRPFASVDALHRAMVGAVAARPEAERVRFFAGHPELAGQAARKGLMTADSVREQGGLDLAAVDGQEAGRWDALNARYRERFGFPFMLCIARHSRRSALAAFERRVERSRAEELEAALTEIGRITRLRLAARIADHGLTDIAGRLTTHVLDIAAGRPAAGIGVALYEAGDDGRAAPGAAPLAQAVTNEHGSTTAPLLGGGPLRIGRYELRFDVGAYFRRDGRAPSDWAFLETVPVVFAVDDPEGDYHLPLAVTPWAYSTYRGQ